MARGISCQNCHIRKVKCDLSSPCGPCSRRNETSSCVRNAPPFAQELLAKIAGLEAELRQKDDGQAEVVAPVQREELSRASTTPSVIDTTEPTLGHRDTRQDIDEAPNETDTELQRTVRALVPRSPDAQNDAQDTSVKDAAVILEFLAWGRRKDQVLQPSSSLQSSLKASDTDKRTSSCFPAALNQTIFSPQLELLEMLFPEPKHLIRLTDFHHKCLVWYHGSYNVVTFQQDYDKFYKHCNGNIRHRDVDYQWLALLFAILTGSITCCTSFIAKEWGFSDAERQSLSKQWYNATLMCLNLGQYLENHSLFAVQAIATLTVSAHTIGMSNTQSILLSSANRIAQALGLHRLGTEQLSQVASEQESSGLIQRETGRRLWIQLCMQDWFNIPFSESCTINIKQCTTGKPLNLNDAQSTLFPPDVPTMTSYCSYHFDFALVIAELQEAMASCNTEYTRYEQVLAHDEKMRQLATAYMPTFLSSNATNSPDWPNYVSWARRGLAICAAHKIIMIHRKFLHRSFQSTTYSFTRRTCIAASKTILKEAASPVDKNGPVLWIDQAFVVTAGIILALDAFHRKHAEPERFEHVRLVKEAISFLQSYKLSTIANRGISLLQLLLKELNAAVEEISGQQAGTARSAKRRLPSNTSNVVARKRTKPARDEAPEPVDSASTWPGLQTDAPNIDGGFDDWANVMMPPDTGFGGMLLFESFHRDSIA